MRGISRPIKNALKRLVKTGRIRPGLSSPIHAVYDPNNPAFQRIRAYKMDGPNVAAFKAVASTGSPSPAV